METAIMAEETIPEDQARLQSDLYFAPSSKSRDGAPGWADFQTTGMKKGHPP